MAMISKTYLGPAQNEHALRDRKYHRGALVFDGSEIWPTIGIVIKHLPRRGKDYFLVLYEDGIHGVNLGSTWVDTAWEPNWEQF